MRAASDAVRSPRPRATAMSRRARVRQTPAARQAVRRVDHVRSDRGRSQAATDKTIDGGGRDVMQINVDKPVI